MKNYTITVNGNVYDVTVEENESGAVSSANAPQRRAPVMPKAAPAPAAAKPQGGEGSIKIEAAAAGKVFKIEASPGASLKVGQTILILEVMKMETPVVATKDGTVASINVSVGQSVETGDLLATMNE